MSAGYIPISRKIFEHEFWNEKRSFSRFEAWMDILQTARFEDKPKTEWIAGKPITWGRGQLPASIRYLMQRWSWKSITRVENFLKYLQNKDMVFIEKGQGQSIVTVCNYDSYNIQKDAERTGKGQQKDKGRTVKGQGKDETNKDNKDNKEIKKEYIQAVLLTEVEYGKLIEKHGQPKTDWMLTKLSNYKQANGKKYVSDYAAINQWVVGDADKNFKQKPETRTPQQIFDSSKGETPFGIIKPEFRKDPIEQHRR